MFILWVFPVFIIAFTNSFFFFFIFTLANIRNLISNFVFLLPFLASFIFSLINLFQLEDNYF